MNHPLLLSLLAALVLLASCHKSSSSGSGSTDSDTDTGIETDTGTETSCDAAWSVLEVDGGGLLHDVQGFAPDSIYIAGALDALSYDGGEWTALGTQETYLPDDWSGSNVIWPVSSTDVWIGGDKCIRSDKFTCSETTAGLRRFDGSSWQPWDHGIRSFTDVWTAADGQTFAVSRNGAILHYDGFTWRAIPSSTSLDLQAVWGSGADDVYAVGGFVVRSDWLGGLYGQVGVVVHFDGEVFTEIDVCPASDTESEVYTAVWGSAADSVYFARSTLIPSNPQHSEVLRWDGTTCELVAEIDGSITDLWGSGPNDIYAVTGFSRYQWIVYSDGSIVHFDGTEWAVVWSADDVKLAAVWGSGTDDVHFAGEKRLEPYESRVFTVRFDGELFSETVLDVDPGGSWGRLWGSGPQDVFLAGLTGTNEILRYDGEQWSELALPGGSQAAAVHGAGPDQVIVVGAYGEAWRFDGESWTMDLEAAPACQRISGIWGSGPDNVYATCTGGSVIHFDGAEWFRIDLDPLLAEAGIDPLTVTFSDVFGFSPVEVVAVGGVFEDESDDTAIVVAELDDGEWSVDSGPVLFDSLGQTAHRAAVWGSSPKDLFVAFAGTSGGVLRRLDGEWIDTGCEGACEFLVPNAVWGSAADDVYVASCNRTWHYALEDSFKLLHFDGTDWSMEIADRCLYGVWGSNAYDVWTVGLGEEAEGAIFHLSCP